MTPVPVEQVRKVAVVGAGTIGASWAACFLANGLEVIAVDPVVDEGKLRRAIDGMMPALESIGFPVLADTSRLQFSATIGGELAAAQFVQESVPERLELKRETLRELESVIDPQVIVSSSATALIPTDIQEEAKHPQRVIVGHPFNPPHLIPLVEVSGGERTAPEALAWAAEFYRAIGKAPVLMKREAYGHIANRLAAALFREAVHLVAEGIAAVGDIDEVITQGPGLRWALQGPFTTYHLAGGAEGIAHYMRHLGPTQEARWRTLGEPELTDELVDRIVRDVHESVAGLSSAQLARFRDTGLVEIHRLKEGLTADSS
ncbi:MAG: 3-hydroxybutyryl-CoA dehydrogenase [Caldilineaceae bacterium SB0661_bin_32]|uniref:3-hydroxybutyryl-CoA dehydrogenase n=1 Tax=Caldilineaceae bacterium SB0661_bin_32 TaxID=2605255 RepID=A0A6B1D268_9CHLR|nr:3-hydroxybutyryl-CoA dehydrogenase [Caldilineaceae bacterium SB0661_bin_32]